MTKCRLQLETLEDRTLLDAAFGQNLTAVGLLASLGLSARQTLVSFVVNTTNDGGAGSLRWAIEQANAAPGPNAIVFQIPNDGSNTFLDVDSQLPGGDAGPDAFVIRPLTPLPALSDSSGGTMIDGQSQSLFGGDANPLGPEVVLDGSRAQGGAVSGLTLGMDAHRNTVLGLNIQGFSGDGISILRSDSNWVFGNYVGTDSTGTEARPNGTGSQGASGGLRISAGASNNVVGSDGNGVNDGAEWNLIAGNRNHGVRIQQGSLLDQTSQNAIRGNMIGTYDVANDGPPVLFVAGSNGGGVNFNVVERNLLLGNAEAAVRFSGFSLNTNSVRDNLDTAQFDNLFRERFGATPRQVAAGFTTPPTAEFEWSMDRRTGPNYRYTS